MTTPIKGKTPSILRRLAAFFYDALLLVGVIVAALVIPHMLLGASFNYFASRRVIQIHFFLVLLVYFVWFWTNGGQTLAMKTWHIRLVSADGGRLRPMQALFRYLAAWPSVLLFGIGLFWALFDPDRQFLHDRLAETRVVND